MHLPPALRHRRFVLLWVGLMVSMAGSQMQLWALFWHISKLTPDPIAVSIVGAIRFLPIVLFSLVAGLMADRYNRRKIMFITQSMGVLVALTLGGLTLSGRIELWHIYLLTGIQAAAASFDLPARQALVPSLVPANDLPSAFSLQSIGFNIGSIIGPGLSGLVIGYFGQEYTYFFNAVTFLGVLTALALMGSVEQPAPHTALTLGNMVTDIRAGIRFIADSPIILSSMILDFFATFFSSANTLLPWVSQNILRVDEIAYGWLAAAQSFGAVSAALIISQLSGLRRQGALLVGAVAVFGTMTILFGFSQWYLVTFVTLFGMGAADAVSTVIRNTIRQLQTPDHIRGRMTSINQIFFAGGPQLGEIEAGAVAQAFGVPAAIITGGAGTLLAAILISLKWPQLIRFDRHEPVEEQKV